MAAADIWPAAGGRRWLWGSLACTVAAFPVAAVLAPSDGAAAPQFLVALLFVSSSVHVASTAALCAIQGVRKQVAAHRVRYLVVPGALVGGTALAAIALPSRWMTWLLVAYFAWQQLHYQKQNLGLAALAASASGLRPLDLWERRALTAAGLAGALGLVAHPGLVQLGPRRETSWLFAGSAALLATAIVSGVLAHSRRSTQNRSVGLSATYLAGLLFNTPIFLLSSPFAAVGGTTIAHGLQYLLLVGMMSAGQERGAGRVLGLALFANISLIGGALLNGASHLHGAGTRALYGGYLGVVMAHFVIDAGIWRLRDPEVRAMVGDRVPFLVPQRMPAESRTSVHA